MITQPGGPLQWRLPGHYRNNAGKLRARSVKAPFVHKFLGRSARLHNTPRDQLPFKLRCMLDERDDCLGHVQKEELKYAYKSKGTVRRKGVYIWVHLKDSNKVYVGSYHSTSLFKRTHTHLSTANSQALKNIPRWKHLTAGQPRQMYSYMLRAGCGDLAVFPYSCCQLQLQTGKCWSVNKSGLIVSEV